MNDVQIFLGRNDVEMLRKIEAFRLEVWSRQIDIGVATTRFSIDPFDYDGWHVVYLEQGEIVAAGRLTIATEPAQVPDLCSFAPYAERMHYPLSVLNRLVVHPDHEGNGLARRLVADRVDLAARQSVAEVWVEVQACRIPSMNRLAFEEMGPSLDTTVAGDWRIMRQSTRRDTAMHLVEQDLRGDFSPDRFCHQFVLGPEFVEALDGWRRVSIDDDFKLTVHPELTVDQVSAGSRSITVIGYILDPRAPEADNVAVAQALLDGFSTVEGLIEATAVHGGRWIIIARDGGRRVLFNDALGLRQVFYTVAGFAHGFWAASQSGLLGWLFDLQVDAAAARFLDTLEMRRRAESRWPGTATPFRGIVHLLPNHALNLCDNTCHRYWPSGPLRKTAFDEGLEQAASLLQGLMRAAGQRFDLVIGMTAGFDSRIVLAASRDIRAQLEGVTVRQGRMPDDHQDLTVAARVLGKLGIPHRVIKAAPYMSAAFSSAFKKNVFLAHDHYGPDAEAILDTFGRRKVVVSGSGAEVARAAFRKRIDATKGEFSAAELANLQWMGEDEFAVNSFNQWLDGLGELHDVHLLDLFCWEQAHGNWLAATQMEFDLAWADIFTPFNCRAFLETLLSVDERHRGAPDYRMFYALIETMWPELLEVPINPAKNPGGGRLRNAGRRVKRQVRSRLQQWRAGRPDRTTR